MLLQVLFIDVYKRQVQLPLPKHISEQKVIETIDYRKDVDGFHPINVSNTANHTCNNIGPHLNVSNS